MRWCGLSSLAPTAAVADHSSWLHPRTAHTCCMDVLDCMQDAALGKYDKATASVGAVVVVSSFSALCTLNGQIAYLIVAPGIEFKGTNRRLINQ